MINITKLLTQYNNGQYRKHSMFKITILLQW